MIQVLITILLGSFKFAVTFPLAIFEFKFSFFETILWINIGGILGIYFFAYIFEALIRWFNKNIGSKRNKKPLPRREGKKIFTRRNRRIIRIKQRYGLPGIAIFTPVLLSIPLGVFLVVRYYNNVKSKFIYLIAGNIVWSFLFTSFYMFFNDLLLER